MAKKEQLDVKSYVNLTKSMLNEQNAPEDVKKQRKKDKALRKKTASNVLRYLNASESKAEAYIKRSIQIAEDPTKFKEFLSEMNEILATADMRIQSFGKRVLNYPKLSISKDTKNIEKEIEDFLKISENNILAESSKEQAYDYFDKNPHEVDKFLSSRPDIKSKILNKGPNKLDNVRILSDEADEISNTAKRAKRVHLKNLKKMSELIVSTRIDPVKVFSSSANVDIFAEARAIYTILTILEDFDRVGKNMGDDEASSEKYLSIITPTRMNELYVTSRRDFNKLITIMLKGVFARARTTGDAIAKAKEKPQSFSMAATGKLQEILASYEKQLFSEQDNNWYDSIRKGGNLRRIFDDWVDCNKINKSNEKRIFRYLLSSPPEKVQRLLTSMLRQTHSPNAPCNNEEEYIPWASPLALEENLKIYNETDSDLSNFIQAASNFFPYSQQKLGFNKPVSLRLVSDLKNSKNTFGRTAYYDPNSMEIVIYTDNRHPKDMLRSFSHELVHHTQNCRGDFDGDHDTSQGYAQNDSYMREKEAEAYLIGNGFMVRDYEDSLKEKNKMLSEEKIREMVREGLKKALFEDEVQEGAKPDYLDLDKDGDKEESMKDAAADAKEDETVDEAHCGKRDDDEAMEEAHCGKRDDDETLEEVEEVEEASTKDTPDRVAGRDQARRLRPLEETEITVESRLQDKNNFLFEKLTKMWTK